MYAPLAGVDYCPIVLTYTQHILPMQLVGEREVRGVVKLRFRDVTGNFVVCHRMLASIQKVPPPCSPLDVCSPISQFSGLAIAAEELAIESSNRH